MAQDLHAEDNRLNRLFKKFSSESKAVSIASIALIVSCLALLMAWMAVYDAKHAKIQVEYELKETHAELTATKNMMTLHNVYLQELYFLMKSEGLEPPSLPEE